MIECMGEEKFDELKELQLSVDELYEFINNL